MFAFISYWRTAAVVLCDMSSTVFYIGAIVESAIGPAAPWFILAVLLFSYAMRSVYIEGCSMFVRGGVYRFVREAMGGFLAKVSVSALLFDYVLTGPISGVSAGQYIIGLALETLGRLGGLELGEGTQEAIRNWGSVAIACAITLYFLRENLLGIPSSSGKAVKIMIATTIMGLVLIAWSGVTLAVRGPVDGMPPWQPDLGKKVEVTASGETVPLMDPVTGEQQDPLGVLGHHPGVADTLRQPTSWLSLIGLIGLLIAFGHSILGMSGLETLAQVYREVEAPKLPNFKKAAFIVIAYSVLLTGTLNFLAVVLVPDDLRMTAYYDNWMGGLAMQMVGPFTVRLLLNAFVVVVGFLILSGAVNTSIIGSNAVLCRVAEDGVLPDWVLRPHPRFGTTHRLLYLIAGLQLFTIIASRGDVLLLGEAYAFGVVWSFVFNTASMVVLRFKDRSPREYRVPLNIRVGDVYVPIGLTLVFIVVLLAALSNLFTKPVATVGGLIFTGVFLSVFSISEAYHLRQRRGKEHEHLEQFNRETVPQTTAQSLGLSRPYCKLVAIRSPHNLFMLTKALDDTDPLTTDVVVMTAKVAPPGAVRGLDHEMDVYDQQLLTAVVEHAERLGKSVTPLLVPTNNALHAVLKVAKELPAQEVILGASNKYTAEEQLDQVALYWISLHEGQPAGVTVHIVSRDRDVAFDLEGGNRIPTMTERQAESVAELREAGVGVRRVLLAHDDTTASHDVFEWLLTMLSKDVTLDLVAAPYPSTRKTNGAGAVIQQDQERAAQLGRDVNVLALEPQMAPTIVSLASEGDYDVLVAPWSQDLRANAAEACDWIDHLLQRAPCSVFLVAHPGIPREVAE